MQEIFISWSKAKSMELAKATKQILETNDIRESIILHQQQNIDRYAASHICDYIVKNAGL